MEWGGDGGGGGAEKGSERRSERGEESRWMRWMKGENVKERGGEEKKGKKDTRH